MDVHLFRMKLILTFRGLTTGLLKPDGGRRSFIYFFSCVIKKKSQIDTQETEKMVEI